MTTNRDDRPPERRRGMPALVALACFAAVLLATAAAPAQDLQSRLDEKQAELDSAKHQEGVLSTTIAGFTDQIDQLTGEVATLRNREAIVQQQLEETQARLGRERAELNILRDRFQKSIRILKGRLVAIYKSDEPDALTVILQADGFDDLLERYQYLTSIEEQDSALVGRVRDLRVDTRNTVEQVRSDRDEIAARKAELARTRAQLEAREADLSSTRADKRDALAATQEHSQELEGDISGIQDQIQAQIQAAQEAAATPALPAGPVPGESSSGFIWPVNGPITSPFCEQRAWESCHPGIDIGVPSGTPVRASAAGTVILVQSEASSGGYGNYICIGHSSTLSTCYAHLQSFSVSQGQHVSQGQVIGISDCTGLCFGPHLHFEVRVNGSPVDPMGYL
jgi:murein DD-endopeptidase MepM/ murein hydrolase activator NlpD